MFATHRRKRGQRRAPNLRCKHQRRRILQAALPEIAVDQAGLYVLAMGCPISLARMAEADSVLLKIHHVHLGEVAAAVAEHVRRGNHRDADKISLRRITKPVRHQLRGGIERKLAESPVVAKDIKLRCERAKALLREPALEAEIQFYGLRMALITELGIHDKRRMILFNLRVDLLFCDFLHAGVDGANGVVTDFHTDILIIGHVVDQDIAHAAHAAEHADLHLPQRAVGLRRAGKILHKAHEARVMPLPCEKLTGEAAADDHIRVVLRAVDPLVDGQIELQIFILHGGIRLYNGERDGKAIVLERMLQIDRVAIGEQND
ncbi:hypothetical protein SDC9_145404 [bioreactor metagenome]|uniref:Uncharacterized protein n=1 Tax=bioreactor metagenome TaxID=1076179 RepID=A0A645E8V9_9ZZZZ